MKPFFDIISSRHNEMIKIAFLGAVASGIGRVGLRAIKSPLKTLGGLFTAAEVGAGASSTSQRLSGMKNVNNLSTYVGPTI
jgi:hypothetical protein